MTPYNGGFCSVMVQWDNGEEDIISLWDMEPLTDYDQQVISTCASKVRGVEFIHEDEAQFEYRPLSGEWGDCNRAKEMQRINKCVIEVSELFEEVTAKIEFLLYSIPYITDTPRLRDICP